MGCTRLKCARMQRHLPNVGRREETKLADGPYDQVRTRSHCCMHAPDCPCACEYVLLRVRAADESLQQR